MTSVWPNSAPLRDLISGKSFKRFVSPIYTYVKTLMAEMFEEMNKTSGDLELSVKFTIYLASWRRTTDEKQRIHSA